MSRVLENAKNQVTQKYKSGSHNGIDLVKYKSQVCNVIAHSDGTVNMIQTGQKNNQGSKGTASYGNFIKIKHSNGYYTLYAHLASVKVKKGDKVKKGQVIGKMGNTGNSYGAHLHFEVRKNSSTRVNPTNYIDGDLPNLPTTFILKYVNTKSGLNVRDKASVSGKLVKTLKYNTQVMVYSEKDGWSNIGTNMYVSTQYLRDTKEVPVPVIEPVVEPVVEDIAVETPVVEEPIVEEPIEEPVEEKNENALLHLAKIIVEFLKKLFAKK